MPRDETGRPRSATRRQFVSDAAALGVTAVASVWSSRSRPANSLEPAYGGRLRLAVNVGGTGDTLDPAKSSGTIIDESRLQGLYDCLTRYDAKNNPQPYLAREWTGSLDRKTWTIRLRQNAAWHDGRPVTADDVVFTFNRNLDPKVGATARNTLSPLVGAKVIAVDAKTVRFELPDPYVDFPALLGSLWTQILPATFNPATANTAPVGSGPFKFESFSPGRSSRFVKNKNWWNEGYPYLDEYEVLDIFDDIARTNALISGQIDFSFGLPYSSIDMLKKASRVKVIEIERSTFVSIALVEDMPPFKDNPKLRQAFAYSLDRQAIADIVYRGHACPGNDHPLPSQTYAAGPTDEMLPQRTQDLSRAKKLLAEAGYPSGIDLTLHTTDAGCNMADLAVVVAEQAGNAGFRIAVKKWPSNMYWEHVWLKENFYISYWSSDPTADLILSKTLYSTSRQNESHFHSAEFDGLITKARTVADLDERREIYTNAMRLVHESASFIIPVFVNIAHGMNPALNLAVPPSPSGNALTIFWGAWKSS
jgi:peptide/nickel transport system substrate-binding protein